MGGNSHFKLSIHIPAPFTVPIWYYTTQNNDVATLPGRFIFQPYVAKDQTILDGQEKKKISVLIFSCFYFHSNVNHILI